MNGSYSKRIISKEDKPSLVKLFMNYENEVYGEVQTSEGELQEILEFIPAGDRIGLWKDGDLVAVSILTEKDHRLPSLILGKPDENLGMYIEEMATELIKSARARKEHISDSKTIILSANLDAEKRTFEKIGFTPTRYWFQMKKNLEGLDNPSIPSSYRISEFNPDTEAQSLYETFEDVFSDHFDYHPSEFQEFIKRFQRPSFDPTLWYLLKEENDMVGFILCSVNEETEIGEISHLGIRKDWRRKGLAHLLLSYAFLKLNERGMKTAALSVDSDSYTDATIVYQKAGMYVYRGFTRYDLKV
ncbi:MULTISPECIES: GNAT family N-acetyltransferase [Bacillaceae]|uniref:GNAT family N-acetyltransferase n=1 Tax=Bacillaceae TaxID=186817 RepID=UPI001C57BCA9|nr:GNAT family N-acetyltransferase [Rossellomorea sp. YZS02]MBW3113076.1 GNAT family N-acetyltransferase [Bacillus sp. MCCB 382]MDX8343674.1 GNAT family N-acetyltransferase [Rossellomorea sp. YZS02]